jgi:hypothetical protein
MGRAIGKMTALAVDKAKKRGYYGDGGGLFLQVSASGSKSWVFRFKEAGKLREMGLGAIHTIGLAEARDKARNAVGYVWTRSIRLRLEKSRAHRRGSPQPRQPRSRTAPSVTLPRMEPGGAVGRMPPNGPAHSADTSIPYSVRSRFKRSM